MTAYKDDFDPAFVQSFELLSYERPRWVTREDGIIEVPANEQEIWTILNCEVNKYLETSLEVPFTFEPFRAELDHGRVQVIIGREENVQCQD